MAPHQILVPTVETVRINALLDLLLTKSCVPLLLVGPPATGKTVYITVSVVRVESGEGRMVVSARSVGGKVL